MKIEIYNTHNGNFPVKFSPSTIFVTDDEGRIHVDPEIIEADGDCVVFEWNGEELMGTAVAMIFMTPEEALRIAKRMHYRAVIDNRIFEWSQMSRRRMGQWCTGFVKRGGSRTWLLPVSDEDALALVNKTKKLVYWTNSRRAEIIAA